MTLVELEKTRRALQDQVVHLQYLSIFKPLGTLFGVRTKYVNCLFIRTNS